MIDLRMPIPLEKAIWLGHAMAERGVYFLEESLSPDDMNGWSELVAHSPTPIATREKESTCFGFAELIDCGKLRIIQPDVARAGGLTECLRIAAHAEARGACVIPHCWSSDILVAATMHLITTLATCSYLEFNAMDLPFQTVFLKSPIRLLNGIVSVPEGPSLGIVVERYQVA
jgi:L-rhamnonate dehydratase